jgi:Flp pilus assembly protein TadG
MAELFVFSAKRHRQHGSVMLLFVLLLPILLGFTAVAVDFSRVLQAKQELQNAADAAALAGAASLDDVGGEIPYNWTAAAHDANLWIGKNPVSTRVLTDGGVTVGYVRPGDPLQTVRSPSETGSIEPFDVPAVRVSLSLSVGHNGGPLELLFGAFLGFPNKDIHAVATAAAYPPGYAAAGALFPIAIGRCMYDLYWDFSARRPKLDPATGKPYPIRIGSVYGGGCFSGEWSTFNTVLNDVPSVQALITNGNPVPIRIGDPTYVQSGVKDAVFNSVPVNKTVAVPVINQVITGSNQSVVAMAAFHIQGVTRVDGKSYILGNFTEGFKSVGLSAGSGGGQDLGAQTGIPSILIQ